MKKKYLIISDNSFILQFEVPNCLLSFKRGYLEIFSSSNKALENIEKNMKQLKFDYKFDKIEHIISIFVNQTLMNYCIYVSDNQLM